MLTSAIALLLLGSALLIDLDMTFLFCIDKGTILNDSIFATSVIKKEALPGPIKAHAAASRSKFCLPISSTLNKPILMASSLSVSFFRWQSIWRWYWRCGRLRSSVDLPMWFDTAGREACIFFLDRQQQWQLKRNMVDEEKKMICVWSVNAVYSCAVQDVVLNISCKDWD